MINHPALFRRIISLSAMLIGISIVFGGSNTSQPAFQIVQTWFDGNAGFIFQVLVGASLVIGGVFGLMAPFDRLFPAYLAPLLLYLFLIGWGVILMNGRGVAGLIVHVALYAIATIEMYSDRRPAKPQPPSPVVFHLQ